MPIELSNKLTSLNDSPCSLELCVEILHTLQRSSGPVVQAVLTLKKEKPLLHRLLKQRLVHNPGLSLAMQL